MQIDQAKLQKAAQGFEAFFIGMVMSEMRKTVPENKLIDGGQGEKTFRSMLDQEYSKAIAERGGFGIAEMIVADVKR